MKKASIIGILITLIGLLAIACQSSEQIEYVRHYSGGKLLYQTHCQNCHGQQGEGLSALIPPLTDTSFIRQNKSMLSCYVKNGASGLMKVSGKLYDKTMPPSGLSNIEIAKVLTYIGNSFGNQIGLVNIEQVEADLERCKNP